MGSSLRLLGAIATVALLTVPATAPASGGRAESAPEVRVEIDFPTSNGFHAHLATSPDKDVTLEIERKWHGAFQGVVYEVPGKVSKAGLKVRFGRLGLIDVGFTPIATLDETAPSPGCTGEPRTLREGAFAGKIAFAGERGFIRIEAPQVEGSMSVIAPWQCPQEDTLSPFEPVPGFARSSARPADRDRESASLVAFSRGHGFFGAGVHHRHSGGRSIFYGAKEEHRERMTITRVTSVSGPASDFDFDPEAGTASLDPPQPLKGHASFKGDRRGGIWRSTIRVPLLGSAPLRTGHGFGAALYPEYQFD
jgi:hypothetical protein